MQIILITLSFERKVTASGQSRQTELTRSRRAGIIEAGNGPLKILPRSEYALSLLRSQTRTRMRIFDHAVNDLNEVKRSEQIQHERYWSKFQTNSQTPDNRWGRGKASLLQLSKISHAISSPRARPQPVVPFTRSKAVLREVKHWNSSYLLCSAILQS
ncbi:hypothetical protein AcV5_002531 [Taiwanofungus camphoratus]|nr:hypothetical protein AcV5_002531 [Antrodia cinnamomea]KAI0918580.1 hypothetical protein AcV5_002531 [Antrodia cinnamomea]